MGFFSFLTVFKEKLKYFLIITIYTTEICILQSRNIWNKKYINLHEYNQMIIIVLNDTNQKQIQIIIDHEIQIINLRQNTTWLPPFA